MDSLKTSKTSMATDIGRGWDAMMHTATLFVTGITASLAVAITLWALFAVPLSLLITSSTEKEIVKATLHAKAVSLVNAANTVTLGDREFPAYQVKSYAKKSDAYSSGISKIVVSWVITSPVLFAVLLLVLGYVWLRGKLMRTDQFIKGSRLVSAEELDAIVRRHRQGKRRVETKLYKTMASLH